MSAAAYLSLSLLGWLLYAWLERTGRPVWLQAACMLAGLACLGLAAAWIVRSYLP